VPDFRAQEAGLGYFYQARYALWLLLDGEEEQSLVLESLDDVVLYNGGAPLALFQTKQHIRRQASLTDASADLWKTLRIWSTHVLAGLVSFPATRLTLVTTASAPDDSIAARLRPEGPRDCASAQRLLVSVARSSTNAELQTCFEAFLQLTDEQRTAMLNCTYVLDQSPNITDTGERIRKRIWAAAAREYREAVFERLQGWWFEQVVGQLAAADPMPISGFEVYDKLAAIAEQFRRDALPIDYSDARPDKLDTERDGRLFVQQLRCISVSASRIEKAILDYYRAFEQRSRWAREDLLVGGEVEAYERKLIDEWERFSAAIADELAGDAAEEELKRVGRDILRWMEMTADIRIRPNVTEPYVMRGSYHMLANRPQPPVWWHPHFMQRIIALVGTSEIV